VGWLVPVPVAAAATTFVVNRTGDAPDLNVGDGRCDTSATTGSQCTLRAAIQQADKTAGADTINFNIGGTTGVKTISPAKPLPTITGPVTINGYTQPGASPNTLATGNDAVLEIQINGTNAGSSLAGLNVQADGCTIKGLVINRFTGTGTDGNGIQVKGSNNTVRGNFIGTDPGGAIDRGNRQSGLIVIGSDNTVGGTARSARNLISGNDLYGMVVEGVGATGNLVQGNYVGTTRAGDAALPNTLDGVDAFQATTTVGGTTAGARNVISGNGRDGVDIFVPGGIVVAGNFIGTDATGTAALGNADSGIRINTADGNTIGGTDPGARNVISGNGQDGVVIASIGAENNTIQGNVIGAAASGGDSIPNGTTGVLLFSATSTTVAGNVITHSGVDGVRITGDGNTIGGGNVIVANSDDGVEVTSTGQGNRILSNQILGNGALGIDLDGGTEDAAGVTANDIDDPDSGANNLQNFPVLSSALRASNGVTVITGSLNSTPSREFTIQLFLADSEPSNHGESLVFLGAKTIATDSGGDKGFSFATGALSPAQEITATATDTTTGDTSEFSLNAVVVQAP
jgi:hypothetical protein